MAEAAKQPSVIGSALPLQAADWTQLERLVRRLQAEGGGDFKIEWGPSGLLGRNDYQVLYLTSGSKKIELRLPIAVRDA